MQKGGLVLLCRHFLYKVWYGFCIKYFRFNINCTEAYVNKGLLCCNVIFNIQKKKKKKLGGLISHCGSQDWMNQYNKPFDQSGPLIQPKGPLLIQWFFVLEIISITSHTFCFITRKSTWYNYYILQVKLTAVIIDVEDRQIMEFKCEKRNYDACVY